MTGTPARGDADTTAPGTGRGAALADEVVAARDRLAAFVTTCPDGAWTTGPVTEGDPRTVGVVVDHVADAYDYIGGWIEVLAGGGQVDVDAGVVDELNARHAAAAGAPGRAEVRSRLLRSGDRLAALLSSLADAAVDGGDGRIARLAHIAARHADSHRSECESVAGGSA